jgi:hypothetical protein
MCKPTFRDRNTWAREQPRKESKTYAVGRTFCQHAAIVLYCGCCPWSHCPNLNPAYDTLRQMGFSKVKVLYLANNFGADWVDKGYPVANGE